MSYFTIYQYSDNVYQLRDSLGVLSTLIVGDQKGLLLDTGYGIGNLKEEVEKITTRPLIVLNSHGHMDHTSGNYQFDEVLINKDDYELLRTHNGLKWRQANIDSAKKMNVLPNGFEEEHYLKQKEGNVKFIEVGHIFDLGDLTCIVVGISGHTKGSIGLYLPSEKLMLVSDAICPYVWLFLEESTTVTDYIASVEKNLQYDFDNFLVGHTPKLFPRSKMVEFLKIAKDLDVNQSIKVSFKNFDHLNPYCYTHTFMYDQDGCGVVFDPNKIE